ncbi:UNKNOWN [Stylonychia lemnae]|uniref:Uncharacterized protein n=1 Tax=Stylonychia lemnae TaxID=5949 RepID=A0A078AD58_STYLE|nr:UNKNOWN [Stylonychia lemnae]|eukprot:CDW80174.1 UNKNOWN [Stylonychia lemnae]
MKMRLQIIQLMVVTHLISQSQQFLFGPKPTPPPPKCDIDCMAKCMTKLKAKGIILDQFALCVPKCKCDQIPKDRRLDPISNQSSGVSQYMMAAKQVGLDNLIEQPDVLNPAYLPRFPYQVLVLNQENQDLNAISDHSMQSGKKAIRYHVVILILLMLCLFFGLFAITILKGQRILGKLRLLKYQMAFKIKDFVNIMFGFRRKRTYSDDIQESSSSNVYLLLK